MLSRVNGVVWMEGREDAESAPWRNQHSTSDREGEMGGSFSAFKSMLDVVEGDEFNTTTTTTTVNHHFDMSDIAAFSPNLISTGHHAAAAAENLSSASCSPSSSVFNNLDTSQLQFFMPPKPTLSSLLGVVPTPNPLFDLSCEGGFLDTQSAGHASNLMNRGCGVLTNFTDLSSSAHLGAAQEWISAPPPTHLLPLEQKKSGLEFGGLFRGGFGEEQQQEEEEGFLLNRSSKLLRPLETFPSVGEQPTLFQKRAALRKNVAASGKREAAAGEEQQQQDEMRKKMATMMMMMKKNKSGEDVSFGGSGLNYDSDELMESFYNNNNGNRMVVEEEEEEEEENESGRNGGGGNNSSNANSTVTADGDHKGKKKKGLPAKNLMAERRRRKKLNDRLYMLRSVVPKISKEKTSLYSSASEFQDLIKQVLSWDIRSTSQRNRPHDSLLKMENGELGDRNSDLDQVKLPGHEAKRGSHVSGDIIYHLILESLDVSYRIDCGGHVIVEEVVLACETTKSNPKFRNRVMWKNRPL